MNVNLLTNITNIFTSPFERTPDGCDGANESFQGFGKFVELRSFHRRNFMVRMGNLVEQLDSGVFRGWDCFAGRSAQQRGTHSINAGIYLF
jgi:hypothetical protein